MYDITVPFVISSPGFDKAEALSAARRMGAKRVLLSISKLGADNTALFARLKECIDFFNAHGMPVGVWYWAFMTSCGGFVPIRGNNGDSAANSCPLDEAYLEFAADGIRQIAAMGPEMILFDDDLRFGHIDSGFGCVCGSHRRLIARELGVSEPELPEDIFGAAFTGEPNTLRKAVMKSWGFSLENFCRRMRQAVDEADPSVRIGICSCMSVWDTDGTDTFTLAKLLAGGTRPYVRLIGAPYWAAMKAWGNRLQDVVELERMEISWKNIDAEVVSEGDTFPRPRYKVPASYLDIFDTALRFTGEFSGIQKYAFDYVGSVRYETGYSRLPDNGYIDDLISGTSAVGVRIYESMKKLEGAEIYEDTGKVPDLFFSYASKVLSANGIPSVYRGSGCAGIAFGENARRLPPEAFDRPLILDLTAARILAESGRDVGIAEFGGAIKPEYQRYLSRDDFADAYDIDSRAPFAAALRLKDGARTLAEFVCEDGVYPAVFRYGDLIVFSASATPRSEFRDGAFRWPEPVWRNYMLPELLVDEIPDIPASAPGHPDLYVQARMGGGRLVVGVWNCHADAINGLELRAPFDCGDARGTGCAVRIKEGAVVVDRLEAFSYCFICVEIPV